MFADELSRVRFEVPDGFEGFRFWPLGIDGRKETKPFAETRIQRLLIVSPFVTAGRLEALGSKEHGKDHILVSRLEELERIPAAALARFAEVHVLDDAADSFEEDDDDEDGLDDAEAAGRALPQARGLHAKLYVADDGAKAHVWTGSANASDAAFTTNVEFLVQLVGARSRFGVDATLNGPPGREGAGLRALLQRFVPPAQPVASTDEEIAVEDLLQAANLAIARAAWIARVSPSEPPEAPRETYDVSLHLAAGALSLPEACTVKVWPIALPQGRALPIDASAGGARAVFERCSFQALTTFFAFELTPTAAPARRCCFVVRVPFTVHPRIAPRGSSRRSSTIPRRSSASSASSWRSTRSRSSTCSIRARRRRRARHVPRSPRTTRFPCSSRSSAPSTASRSDWWPSTASSVS